MYTQPGRLQPALPLPPCRTPDVPCLARRAVLTIHEHFHEPLSLDELARSALVSKFYFLRVFQRATGVTPGRFLGAVRLHEAKRLLAHTSLNVVDVASRVGYSSTSTFSRRFTALVGISPTRYRKAGLDDFAGYPKALAFPRAPGACGAVSGVLRMREAPRSPIHIGVFDSPVLQGRPAASTTIDGPGPYRLHPVPPGTWYVHAVARAAVGPLLVDTVGPVETGARTHTRVDVTPTPQDWARPPVLLALSGLGPMPCAMRRFPERTLATA